MKITNFSTLLISSKAYELTATFLGDDDLSCAKVVQAERRAKQKRIFVWVIPR